MNSETMHTSVLYIYRLRSCRVAVSAPTPCERPGGLEERFVKKRSILSLVAVGLMAATLPGVAVAQVTQADGTTTFTVLAPDYIFDGRLASNLTREYAWDRRLASTLAPDLALTK